MNTPLHYISRPSIHKNNAPLLILCHGYGSDEHDLFSFANELTKELYIVSLKAPIPMQPYGNAWYAINFDAVQGKWSDNDQAITSRDLIADFIDQAIKNLPINSKNISLLGFSQGSILSYAVALTYPEKVKNIIALSGYINEDIFKLKENLDHYKHLDFYCSHGSVDQVIPVQWAQKSPRFLSSKGIKNYYKEFPVGHGVAPQNFHEFNEWLKQRI